MAVLADLERLVRREIRQKGHEGVLKPWEGSLPLCLKAPRTEDMFIIEGIKLSQRHDNQKTWLHIFVFLQNGVKCLFLCALRTD